MQYGQPPSWRPDVEQYRAEAYRGTVRDALGGLRNLEQLLGSLRVGPRALTSVLPDVRSSCPALADALEGLSALVGTKLKDAEKSGVDDEEARQVLVPLRTTVRASLDALSDVIASVEQQALNAKHRLRLQETVSNTARDLEAIVDLIDMLGEVVWGRTMLLDIVETAREAYRSGDAPPMASPPIRLALRTDSVPSEHTASPRAVVLVLHHLVRWSASQLAPDAVPLVSLATQDRVEITVQSSTESDDLRWVPGRRQLAFTESALRLALKAMKLELTLEREPGRATIVFPAFASPLP
jgi:hypothetical protein